MILKNLGDQQSWLTIGPQLKCYNYKRIKFLKHEIKTILLRIQKRNCILDIWPATDDAIRTWIWLALPNGADPIQEQSNEFLGW